MNKYYTVFTCHPLPIKCKSILDIFKKPEFLPISDNQREMNKFAAMFSIGVQMKANGDNMDDYQFSFEKLNYDRDGERYLVTATKEK